MALAQTSAPQCARAGRSGWSGVGLSYLCGHQRELLRKVTGGSETIFWTATESAGQRFFESDRGR
ncbi:MAG TPA: hypothetical protein VFD73_20545, partial [Gemmatimonadales bacterium]|nr:hypothetical protein [Gemmatimonadales bacterium]